MVAFSSSLLVRTDMPQLSEVCLLAASVLQPGKEYQSNDRFTVAR